MRQKRRLDFGDDLDPMIYFHLLQASGVARNYVYGGRPERRRREGRDAEGAEWAGIWGSVVSTEIPQWGPGRSPGRKRIFSIL